MSERQIEAFPRVQLDAGETYLLRTRSGARHLMACLPNHHGVVARIGPDGTVRLDALFHAHALVVGTNYNGENAWVVDGPVRVGARARYYTLGYDEWWSTSAIEEIHVLPPVTDRDEVEALVESFALAATVTRRLAESNGSVDFDEFAAEVLVSKAADLVASRSTWHTLAEVCERLGLDEEALRARARQLAAEGDEQ